jgi:hypothetical protein
MPGDDLGLKTRDNDVAAPRMFETPPMLWCPPSQEEDAMRTNRGQAMMVAVLAIGVVAGRAAAAEPAPSGEAPAAAAEAPAAGGQAPAAQPAPRVAARPASATAAAGGAAQWHEGFQLVPSLGVHSIQGDGGMGTGPGLRLGLLAGSRIVELLSLNVGFAFDMVNIDGPSASRYVFDIGFNPLFHFPLEKVEIVAGPILGVFLDKMAVGSGNFLVDTWAYGWTAGLNGGVMFPVGSKVRLGGLANFFLHNPLKVCITANGSDTCQSDGLNSGKVLSLSFAAML